MKNTEQLIQTVYMVDGHIFKDLDIAEERAALVRRINRIMAPLKSRLDVDLIIERDGYYAHEVVELEAARTALDEIAKSYFGESRNRGLYERTSQECGFNALYSSYWRLSRCDFRSGREFEQPYYVLHQNEVQPNPCTGLTDADICRE